MELEFVSAILVQLDPDLWGTTHNFKVPTGQPDVGTFFMRLVGALSG
jgi:hypothetical protein